MNDVAELPGSPTSDSDVRWKFGTMTIIVSIATAALLGWTFRDGIREPLHLWEHKEEYSHAYLLPFLSLFLFWQKKHELTAQPWRGSWLGVAIVLGGLLIFFVGTLSAIFAIIHYALIITVL